MAGKAKALAPQLGKGTFRIYDHSLNALYPVAWAWVTNDLSEEYWIFSNEFEPPEWDKFKAWVIIPVPGTTQHLDQGSHTNFKIWVETQLSTEQPRSRTAVKCVKHARTVMWG